MLIIAAFSVMGSANAGKGSQVVAKARQAYDKENVIALTKYTTQLQAQGHLLAPYAEYWLMHLDIENTDNYKIKNFLTHYSDYAFANRLRGKYLKKLGLHKKWDEFSEEYAKYQSENAAISCYAEEAYHVRSEAGTLASAKHLWITAKSQPNDCGRLFDLMQAQGIIDEAAIWERFRLALGQNRVSLAKSIVKRSKHYQPSYPRLLKRAAANPKTIVDKKQISFKSRFGREVNLYALLSVAKKKYMAGIKCI